MRHVPPAMALLALLAAPAAQAASRTYTVDAKASTVTVAVGKSGAFSFAGHEHRVRAGEVSGTVVVDVDDPTRSELHLTLAASALKVLAEGADEKDAPAVQEAMLGPKVLDVARFAEIKLTSRQVSATKGTGDAWTVRVVGDLTLHGVSRPITVPVTVKIEGDRLTAKAEVTLRQTEFGIQPVSAGGGTVKVKDELVVTAEVVAVASP